MAFSSWSQNQIASPWRSHLLHYVQAHRGHILFRFPFLALFLPPTGLFLAPCRLTDSGPGPHGGLPIPLHIIGMAPPGHAALPAAEEPQSDHQHAHRREGKQKDQRQDPVRQVTHPSARAPAGLPFSAVVLISLISVICHHSASPGVLLYRIPDPSQNNIDFFLKFLENFSSGSGPLSSTYTILSYCREGEK